MLFLLLSFMMGLDYSHGHDLEITISEIKEVKGNMHVALYDREEGFRDEDAVLDWKIEKVQDHQMTVNFYDLPHGEYAVAVFHDKNENGKMDKNIIGIPKEGYGFSNDAAKKLRAPYFREAKINIEDFEEIEIKMVYR